MRMAPEFWNNPRQRPGWQAHLLAPLSGFWSRAAARRHMAVPQSAGVPVICVGNLTAGGTGKTPTVCALAARLAERGVQAHILTRGYGGTEVGPVRVDLSRHDAAGLGDEPLLLAGFAPVWVARDRVAGARAAVAAGAEILIMDDGFQNPALGKDFSLLVVDAETGFGNGRVIPGGPLREALVPGLARADILLSIGPEAAQQNLAIRWPEIADLPRLKGHLAPLATGMDWTGQRVLAFAGIGRPEKFFRSLQACGADVVATRAFPDHATYGRPLLARLTAEAREKRAQLVTTEKDAVRLPVDFRANVLTLPVRLALDDWAPLDAALSGLTRPVSR